MVMMMAILMITTIIINKLYEFLGCEQEDKIGFKHVMERVKKEINKKMEQLVGMSLYDRSLIKPIYSRVILVARYVINVCDLRKDDLKDLGKIVKTALRDKEYHGRESNDEKLYAKIEEGGRSFITLKEVYDETKVRIAG